MAKEGTKVLLVDTDPQGDLTTYMGFYDQENIPVTIATLFDRTMNDQEINVKDTERDILICDEYGFAETKAMPYATYNVHQILGWEGRELIKDFEVYISEDGILEGFTFIVSGTDFMGNYFKEIIINLLIIH